MTRSSRFARYPLHLALLMLALAISGLLLSLLHLKWLAVSFGALYVIVAVAWLRLSIPRKR